MFCFIALPNVPAFAFFRPPMFSRLKTCYVDRCGVDRLTDPGTSYAPTSAVSNACSDAGFIAASVYSAACSETSIVYG